MLTLFAYLVAFLSVVYAVVVHRIRANDFWLPCLISAFISAITAVVLFQFIQPQPASTSYLQIAGFGLFFSFVLAVLIGYFVKVLPNLFK